MDAKAETWCDRDEHKIFEYCVDFNERLDSEDAASVREAYKVEQRPRRVGLPRHQGHGGKQESSLYPRSRLSGPAPRRSTHEGKNVASQCGPQHCAEPANPLQIRSFVDASRLRVHPQSSP